MAFTPCFKTIYKCNKLLNYWSLYIIIEQNSKCFLLTTIQEPHCKLPSPDHNVESQAEAQFGYVLCDKVMRKKVWFQVLGTQVKVKGRWKGLGYPGTILCTELLLP